MFSGRQVEEESTLSSQYTVLKEDIEASFSNKLIISNTTNSRFLMAKNSFANNSNLTINIDKSATFSVPRMKRLSKQISRNSNFFKAELTHNEPKEKFLPAMLACIGPQKSLSSLKLKIAPQNFKENTFQNLTLDFPNLSKLDISFLPNSKITGEILTHLGRSLTCFPFLTELSLDLSGLALSNADFLILVKRIQRIPKNLRQMKLNLSKLKKLSSAGIEELGKSLLKLEKISSLELDLSECPLLEDQDIEKLFANLKTAKNLTSLALALKAPKKLTQRSLQLLLGHESKKPEGSFTLGIVLLGSEIKLAPYEPSSFSQLKRLRLDLGGWKKGKAKMSLDLGGCFRSFPNLKTLDLEIGNNRMLNERDLTDICLGLIRLKALSKLHLNFSALNKNLTSEAVINLGHTLQALRLAELKLDMSKCVKIKPATWSSLFEELGSLEELTNLSLNFADSKGISKQEVQQLALSLKEITSLICLDLNFSFCDLRDEALQNLTFLLKNHENLQILKTAFEGDFRLTSKGFLSMSSGFKEAPSLREINLKIDPSMFPNNSKKPNAVISCIGEAKSLMSVKLEADRISKAQLLALSDHLAELDHVPCIKLHFLNGDRISPRTKSAFAKNLRKLRGLEEFELVIDANELYFVFEDFSHIEWSMNDIRSGSGADLIERYRKALKRERRKNIFLACMFILLNLVDLALLLLLPHAFDSSN